MSRAGFSLTSLASGRFDIAYAGCPLFCYVYLPDVPRDESPRPYIHPLYTLAGTVVTGFRPPDHRWHHGLSLTCAHLSGENFWGGPTYVRGQGYVQLPNNGTQAHLGWDEITVRPSGVVLQQRLAWVTQAGARWLTEERRIAVMRVDRHAGWWTLDLCFTLHNVHHTALVFGSPTTEGRPAAGYGGLFWRGDAALAGGTVCVASGAIAQGSSDELVMGQRGAWLAYLAPNAAQPAALLFLDHPANPRHPTPWFARPSYAGVSAAFMYDTPYELPSGAVLTLRYRLVIAASRWTREQAALHAATLCFSDNVSTSA